jgi:hypothetical protein
VRRYLRLSSVLSLAALAAIFCAYDFLNTNSYNKYCENEGGYLAYDPIGSFKIALIWFAILALPCLVAKRQVSSKLYASISIMLTAIFIIPLFSASDPPLECFTSGGNTVTNGFDIFFPLSIVFASIIFYVVFVFDIVASFGEGRHAE